jgi:maleate cis-trans isomerase
VTSDSERASLLDGGYGWRARIGFLSPGVVDESLSRQFYRMAPPGVTMVRTSLGVTAITPGQMVDAVARAEAAARELSRERPDCIIIGGSPTVVINGYGADEELSRLVEEATGITTTAAQTAAVEAFRVLGASRIAVATPFPDPFPGLLRDFLEASGFVVCSLGSLSVDYRKLTSTPLRAGYELGKAVFGESGGADVLYFPGAPFPIVDAIGLLEDELNTTVVTSLQATLWKGLRLAQATDRPIEGYGRLLSEKLGA